MVTNVNILGPMYMPRHGDAIVPEGGLTRYVYQDVNGNGIGSLDQLPSGIADICDNTLATALTKCRANRGDKIIVLPGHVESVTATSHTWVAGVRVLCRGTADERPTFNWTVAGSIWTINVANVYIENAILNMAATAATTVTKAMTVTGAGLRMVGNKITLGASATQLATTGIELATGADRAWFMANDIFSTANAANTDVIKLTNAVDHVWITDNSIDCGMTGATSSLVTMTTAPTNIFIANNSMRNSITSSTKALVGISAATGRLEWNMYYITNATGGATAAGTFGNLGNNQNFGCATNGSGLLCPAAGG
jgi:hypothetical protein